MLDIEELVKTLRDEISTYDLGILDEMSDFSLKLFVEDVDLMLQDVMVTTIAAE